jgi:hypothetical protein
VMFVDDSGPAARAGLEEGNRIAAIEGVDLRVGHEDAGDDFVGNTKVRRLQREIARLHPGDDVELRVYANGRFRSVQLKAARASDLPRRRGVFIVGDGFGALPPAMPFGLDGALIGGEVRAAIERAMDSAGHALEGVGRGLGRVYWQDDMPDDAPRAEPIEPVHVEPLEPSRMRAPSAPKMTYRAALLDDALLAPSAGVLAAAREPLTGLSATASAVNVSGLRMVPVGSELAAYLGRGSDRGLLVVEVPQWAREALQPGDVVLAVDGRDVRPAPDEVTIAVPRARASQLDILRDGVHHSVTLPARR